MVVGSANLLPADCLASAMFQLHPALVIVEPALAEPRSL